MVTLAVRQGYIKKKNPINPILLCVPSPPRNSNPSIQGRKSVMRQRRVTHGALTFWNPPLFSPLVPLFPVTAEKSPWQRDPLCFLGSHSPYRWSWAGITAPLDMETSPPWGPAKLRHTRFCFIISALLWNTHEKQPIAANPTSQKWELPHALLLSNPASLELQPHHTNFHEEVFQNYTLAFGAVGT